MRALSAKLAIATAQHQLLINQDASGSVGQLMLAQQNFELMGVVAKPAISVTEALIEQTRAPAPN